MIKPTNEQFEAFKKLFDHLNKNLFEGSLPIVNLNFYRKRKVGSYEISITPHIFSLGKRAVIQSMVHEMCHLWQEEYGDVGSLKSRGYHNKQWSNKMESVGLVPSHTGEPGGRKTGTKMSEYIEPGGVLDELIDKVDDSIWLPFKNYQILGVDQLDEFLLKETNPEKRIQLLKQIDEYEVTLARAKKKQKVKYSCPSCSAKVWGKSGLKLMCGDCNVNFVEV